MIPRVINFLFKMLAFGIVLVIVRSPILMLLVGIITGVVLGIVYPEQINNIFETMVAKIAEFSGSDVGGMKSMILPEKEQAL